MAIVAMITADESQSLLAHRNDWLALDDDTQDIHIWNASLHIQHSWSCTDVEWDDDTTWPDDMKMACALYAYADFLGVLYKDAYSTEPRTRMMVEKTQGVGSLRKTLRWAERGPAESGNALSHANALMETMCTRSGSGGAVELNRV